MPATLSTVLQLTHRCHCGIIKTRLISDSDIKGFAKHN